MNFLIIEALETYSSYFGEDFTVEYPTRSGNMKNLKYVAMDLRKRLLGLFIKDKNGKRPCHGESEL